ncbi:MAG: hypothetical protein ACYCVB_08580 [Bacilli bacterium]
MTIAASHGNFTEAAGKLPYEKEGIFFLLRPRRENTRVAPVFLAAELHYTVWEPFHRRLMGAPTAGLSHVIGGPQAL